MEKILLYLFAYILVLYNAYLRELADRMKKENDLLKRSLGKSYDWILARQNKIRLDYPELWTADLKGFFNSFWVMIKLFSKKIKYGKKIIV